MEKYTYFVIDEVHTETGKSAARALKIHNSNNLLSYFTPRNGYNIISINSCDTWKQAQEIARAWNTAYEDNGVYLFG